MGIILLKKLIKRRYFSYFDVRLFILLRTSRIYLYNIMPFNRIYLFIKGNKDNEPKHSVYSNQEEIYHTLIDLFNSYVTSFSRAALI